MRKPSNSAVLAGLARLESSTDATLFLAGDNLRRALAAVATSSDPTAGTVGVQLAAEWLSEKRYGVPFRCTAQPIRDEV